MEFPLSTCRPAVASYGFEGLICRGGGSPGLLHRDFFSSVVAGKQLCDGK